MGNADLRQLAVIEEVSFDDLDGGVVAVDAHNWLYRYLTITVKFSNESVYTTEAGEEVANLIGIVRGLPKFFEHDLTPIFVFDGEVTHLKSAEIEDRRAAKAEAQEKLAEAREAGDAVAAAKFESRTQRLTDTIQSTTRELFDLLDVPYIEAPAEGEAQAAFMARTDEDVDYAGSEDYDTLLLGAPVTLRKLTSRGNPERMDHQRTLDEHEITREQLVDVAILMGTDFNDGVTGYGPKTALEAIREHGDLWSVLEAEDETIERVDEIRELFLNPAVTDDYDVDLDPTPDIDAAKAYVTEEYEVPMEEVERGFERIAEAISQTGLDRWT